MSSHGHFKASEIRARVNHPIIDADGHWQEYAPVMSAELKRIGGDRAVEGFFIASKQVERALAMSVAERRHQRMAQPAFWDMPTKNTRDLATAMMPRLLYDRLDEFGIDFAILYPTRGLGLPRIPDAPTRQAACRAFNIFSAEYFGDFSDRLTPAAVIPMHTPEEAIAELEYVTSQLGLKVIMMGSLIRRPIPALVEKYPDVMPTNPWFDMLGLDSEYDYDPVWAKCDELGLSPTFHSGGRGFALRVSPSNFVYNHIGHFASAGEAVCKAIFLGGVTRRFPKVKFGFLEGGVGWACNLYADLIGHWEKRCLAGLEDVDPKNLDRALLLELAQQYANDNMVTAIRTGAGLPVEDQATTTGGIAHLDDYSACAISRVDDFRELFVKSFYFGCEADDPINAWAFNRQCNPLGVRLNTLFGSDIGHFDVPDMADVVPEAYELLEDHRISADDFRDFVFASPVRFWGEANPDFFKGTVIEKDTDAILT